jgi:predicted enzyme related to lactoylglutathione lyase
VVPSVSHLLNKPAHSVELRVPPQWQKEEQMTDYAPGAPMWVDVSSPDLAKTNAFYTGLFGWEAQQVPDPEAGGYTMYFLDGKMVGAAGPTFSPDQHPAWATYLHSVDAGATAQAVQDAGGQVVMGPMDVMGQGRMAVFSDPTGAFISIWQPQIHQGAELVYQAGALGWNELYTRDMPAAKEFYSKVFGWSVEESDMPFGKYWVFQVNGKQIAGGLDMTTMLPDSVPPHWLVYFAVTNTEESMNKVKELGGTVIDGPNPTPMGPMAVLQDPVGASFAIIQVTPQS